MSAADGHLDGAFYVVLPADFGEIQLVVLVAGKELLEILPHRFQLLFSKDELEHLAQVSHAVNVNSFDHCGFAGIRLRHDDFGPPAASRLDRDGENPFDRADGARERELADEAVLIDFRKVKLLADGHHGQCDRKIKARSLLLYIGGGEIDRGAAAGPVIAAVADGSGDAITALFHSGIRQADDDNLWFAAAGVHLDFDFECIDAVNSSRKNLREHGRKLAEVEVEVKRFERLLRKSVGRSLP